MGQDFCVISNGSQLAATHTFDDANPTWYNATPSLPVGAMLCAFAIDPVGNGAWALTAGGADADLVGIFRCADIHIDSPSFSLVYTQDQAMADGQAALTAAGWGASPAFESIQSMATGADGTLVASERKWLGFADRPPAVVFVTNDYGVHWTAYVPSGGDNHRFGPTQYLTLHGNHHTYFDGVQYIIGGTVWWPYFHSLQGIAYSADGVSWLVSEVNAPGYEQIGSYNGGYSLFDDQTLVQLPSTVVDVITHTITFYRHFMFGGMLCYLAEDDINYNIQNYLFVNGINVVDSADVFGAARIGGAALRNVSTYILVAKEYMVTGMVVCERSGGINTNKTGNLLTALGGAWNGGPTAHFDNLQVEFIARGIGAIYTHKVRIN